MATQTISAAVREAARHSGETQLQLAAGAGVSQRAISDFLSGKSVSASTLDAIAGHLGIRAKVPKKYSQKISANG